MGIERRFPLSQDSFHLCEDFLRVEVPGRLAFRHPRGFGDPRLAIGEVLVMEAVRIGPGERGSGVPDLPIENTTAVPAPFALCELVKHGHEVIAAGRLGLEDKVLFLGIPEPDLRLCVAFRGQGKQQAVFLLGVGPPVGEALRLRGLLMKQGRIQEEHSEC